MTSQKRYRHHQDNNSQRFRDLPPRFKRQKSLTSQSSPAPPASGPSTSPTLTEQSARSSPSPNASSPSQPAAFDMTRRSHTGNGRQEHSTSRPHTAHSNAQTQWQGRALASPNSKPVLSQVDNRNSKSPSIPAHYQMVKEEMPVSYSRLAQVPVAAWPANSQVSSVSPNHPTYMSNPNPWAPISLDMYADQRVQSPPFYMYNNENYAPTAYPSPASPWSRNTYSPYQSAAPSPSPGVQSSANPADVVPPAPASSPNERKEQSAIDISDPDIRTIEMLRELERVADQKESESEDFGSDRKTLVSHHLRMLMCAVDRYTEGIDDDLKEDSRGDEVFAASPASSARTSPAPTKQSQDINKTQVTNTATSQPPQGPAVVAPTWGYPQYPNRPTVSAQAAPVIPAVVEPAPSVWSSTPAAPKPTLQPFIQVRPSADTLSPMTPRTPEWNLWSSPGIDFFGVYRAPEEQSVNPLDHLWCGPNSYSTPDKRERRALYNR